MGKNQPEKLFTHNHSNQLTGVSQGGTNYSYAYNGLGDRLRQSVGANTTNYVIDNSSGLSQVLADGTNTYLYGLDGFHSPTQVAKITSWGMLWEVYARWPTPAVGSSLAAIMNPMERSYSAMGSSNTAYGFTSEWTDGTGLVIMTTRNKFFCLIRDLTNPLKRANIRISINYRCVPGKCEPAFVRLAVLQNPPHKWHGFRSITHNPEVSGSNPLPATKTWETRSIFLSGSNPQKGTLSTPPLL